MFNKLEIGDISLKYPIIQGGMGVGISLGSLAGHVSLAGGLGVISTAQIGYYKELFQKDPFKANMEALEEQIQKAKKISNNGFIGVNIMAATVPYDEYVKKAIQCGADLIISGAGIAKSLPSLVKGTKTKFAPIFSSLRATKVILKMWDKRFNVVPDLIVIEGPKAGGHLGFSEEQLDHIDDLNYDDELVQILDHVKEYEEKYLKKIPTVFAGGITTKQDVEHYMNLGFNGVQVGTRFVTTKECDAHENFKKMYTNSKEEDIVIIKSPVGMPARAINSNFVQMQSKPTISKCFQCLQSCDVKTTPYCITNALIDGVKGDMENGLFFCGQNVYKTDKITTVEEVIQELMV